MGIVVRDKKFPSATGICDVRYRIWAPDEPRACVQIIHGMAEHIELIRKPFIYLIYLICHVINLPLQQNQILYVIKLLLYLDFHLHY